MWNFFFISFHAVTRFLQSDLVYQASPSAWYSSFIRPGKRVR